MCTRLYHDNSEVYLAELPTQSRSATETQLEHAVLPALLYTCLPVWLARLPR